MNRTYRSFLAVCCVVAVLITSCTKTYNKNVIAQPISSQANLNSLFAAFRPTPQYLVVTAGFNQTVYGANGTRLTFYPNSFKDAKGNIIATGIVVIKLTEIYTLGDMVASRAATTSGGQLLTSGGQVLITATMNGQEVYANKYGIGFRQAAPSQQPMMLFYGTNNTPDSVTTWAAPGTPQTGASTSGTVSLADTSVVVVITSSGPDTITTHGAIMQYYQFDSCASFNWINCDYFYTSASPLTDVSVVMPDTSFNQSNTEVFLLFPSINAAAHMTQYTPTTNTFDLPQGYYIPIGITVDVVVATNKNGTYYYYQQTGITTTSGMVISPTMAQATLAYITNQLQGL